MGKTIVTILIVIVITFVCLGCTTTKSIIYVDADAPVGGDGKTWKTAYTYLQNALDQAVRGDEIWVAVGTYKPTTEVGGSGDRYNSFQMKNGVALYGGFEGI